MPAHVEANQRDWGSRREDEIGRDGVVVDVELGVRRDIAGLL